MQKLVASLVFLPRDLEFLLFHRFMITDRTGNSLEVLMYIFVLKKACSLAAGWYRLSEFGQKAAANGSCSQMLRGSNLHPCCSLFVAQIVPKRSQKIWALFLKQGGSDCCQAFKRLYGKTRRQKLNLCEKQKRSFGPSCKDSASLSALLK